MPGTNTVSQLLDSLDDGKMMVGLGDASRRQIATKLEDGAHVQKVTVLEGPEQAGLTLANTDAVEGNTAEIGTLTAEVGQLGGKVDEQTAATKDNTTQLGELGKKLDTANGYAATTAAQAAAGDPYAAEWTAAQLTGGQTTLLTATQNAADRKVLRAMVACSQIAGSILGGSARIYVYHCANAGDAFNANGAVVIGISTLR